MLIVYNNQSGVILGIASSVVENGVRRELSKDECFSALVGESLVLPDDDNVLSGKSKYTVSNGALVAKEFKKISIGGITQIPANVTSTINVTVSNSWSGALQLGVNRGKLSSKYVTINSGAGSFTLQTPNETINISLAIVSEDTNLEPLLAILEVA